ncbi:MAG: type II secretion system minor pseudopilin GspK [Rubrivivax sp.]|nr:type II secretion system minor pseudopilin GspK [Rubrivivax sp.]
MNGRAPRVQRGSALLLAMIILAVVATLSAGMVWQQRRAVEVEAAERARVQAAWILAGALDWARLILREDLRDSRRSRRPVDSLDEPWATPLAEARLSTFLAADRDNNADGGPEAFLSGAIVDAQSRFNLRGLVDGAGVVVPVQLAAFDRLASLAGLPTGLAERIADGLAQAQRPAATGNPADAAATPLRPARLADLAWLGVDAETIARLAPWAELLPVPTPVNANTAPREVLVAAIDGLDLGSAERLVQRRQREPFASMEQLQAELPEGVSADPARVGVASAHFEVAGRLRLEDRVLEEVSLLQRRPGERDDVVVLRRERRSFNAPAR